MAVVPAADAPVPELDEPVATDQSPVGGKLVGPSGAMRWAQPAEREEREWEENQVLGLLWSLGKGAQFGS